MFERNSIKKVIHSVDPSARVFLFGSRTDSKKSGGDIDLLVESIQFGLDEKLRVLSEIKKVIGDQKIDLVISKSLESETDPFVLSILEEKREL